MPNPITVTPFSQEYRDQVPALILAIQTSEFDIPITLQEQPDLLDIPNFYQRGYGNFWVALDGDQVVGTIALLDIGEGQAALRKMFVAPNYRGKERGTAALLLNALLDSARAQGVREIYLGTTPFFQAAHRFYEKHGFTEISPDALPPNFPRMKVDTKFYRYTLTR